jgi:hypothetical protein
MLDSFASYAPRRRLCAPVVVLLALAVLAGAVPAGAEVTHHPQGAFAIFSSCPLNNSSVRKCMVATTTGGELRLDRMVLPITKTFQVLRGGLGEEMPDGTRPFVAPESGAAIQPTPLPIPGGLSGALEPSLLPSSLRTTLDSADDTGLGALTVTIEVAGPASAISFSEYNALLENGVALEVPLRIKLTNPFLGEECYIGSASDPIVVQATTGTTSPLPPNMPLEGKAGYAETLEEGRLAVLTRNVDVADSFAVPTASGCGGSLAPLIDRAIDAKIGLPSPAGRNSAILDNTVELATATSVRNHE